jgi:hypothetical protein
MPPGDAGMTPLSWEEGIALLSYGNHKKVAKGHDLV